MQRACRWGRFAQVPASSGQSAGGLGARGEAGASGAGCGHGGPLAGGRLGQRPGQGARRRSGRCAPRQQAPCGEQGVPGVEVQLVRDGVVINSTTTDASGRYSFADVRPGNCSVWFTAPAGSSFSTFPSGQTPLFPVSSGQAYQDVDIGLYTGKLAGPYPPSTPPSWLWHGMWGPNGGIDWGCTGVVWVCRGWIAHARCWQNGWACLPSGGHGPSCRWRCAGAAIGDTAFLDSNANGVQDANSQAAAPWLAGGAVPTFSCLQTITSIAAVLGSCWMMAGRLR